MGYVPGKENTVADVLSRWAYPASQALWDISKHGSAQDTKEMQEMIDDEREDERNCMWIRLRNQPCPRNAWIRGIKTRSGKSTSPREEDICIRPDGEGSSDLGGTKPHVPETGSTSKGKKVKFAESHPVVIDATYDSEDEVVLEPQAPNSPPDFSNLSNSSAFVDEAGNEQPMRSASADAHPSSSFSSTTNLDGESPTEGGGREIRPPVGDYSDIWALDWGREYMNCPRWGEVFKATLEPQGTWPGKVKLFKDKMYLEERLCVPSSLTKSLIRDHHSFLGHVGFERLWKSLVTRFQWPDLADAKKFAKTVLGQCEVCQACQRPTNLKGWMDSTPIPPMVMQSVALDLFSMPPVEWEGSTYDTMVVCVDRHSGWVVAIPCLGKGLTGSKVAKLMLQHQWRPFGVPSIITSDLGLILYPRGGKRCVPSWEYDTPTLKPTTTKRMGGPRGRVFKLWKGPKGYKWKTD